MQTESAVELGRLGRGVRIMRADRSVVVAGALLVMLCVLASVGAPPAEVVTGHGPEQPFSGGLSPSGIPLAPLSRELRADGSSDPAGALYLLGTDRLGRDTFVRLLHGARVTLVVGFAVTLLALIIGVSLGLAAGYFRGRIDAIVSRATEAAIAFPSLLFAIGLAAVLGPGLLNVIVVIATFSWYYPARIVLSAVLSSAARHSWTRPSWLGRRMLEFLAGICSRNSPRRSSSTRPQWSQ